MIDAVVVFRNVDEVSKKWWLRPLKDGFKHVEIWLQDRDVWVRMDPCFEFPVFEAHFEAPWEFFDNTLDPTYVAVLKVIPAGSLKTPWSFGPLTCVEAVKLALGLRLPLVRTPHQLYRHLLRGP